MEEAKTIAIARSKELGGHGKRAIEMKSRGGRDGIVGGDNEFGGTGDGGNSRCQVPEALRHK